jgi:hypothetical protein
MMQALMTIKQHQQGYLSFTDWKVIRDLQDLYQVSDL